MVRKILIKDKVKKKVKKISDRNFGNGHLFFVQFSKMDPEFFQKNLIFHFRP